MREQQTTEAINLAARQQQLPPVLPQGQDVGALSIRKFCDAYGIHSSTFYRWAEQGLAPAVMEVGGRRFITRRAITAWEKQHASETVAA